MTPFVAVEVTGVRPQAWRRAGSNNGHRYTPVEVNDAETEVGWLATEAMAGRDPLDVPCILFARFVLPTKARVDVDNLLKLTMDALNGIAYADDSLVVLVQASKVYAADCDGDPMPGTWLRVYRARMGLEDQWEMVSE